jgi:hypothetical protein
MKRFSNWAAGCAMALVAAAFTVHAADTQAQRAGNATGAQGQGQAGQQGGPRGGPPQEAMAACQSLSAGQACSFRARDRDLTGSCWAPEGKPLACKPANAPGRQNKQKTPEPNR